jgi:serine/threonine protein kinase
MSVFQSLSVVALRQLVSTAGNAVGLGTTTDAIVESLTTRFTDHSQKLTKALQTATERAWKALEVALAGNSLLSRCTGALAAAEDRTFSAQLADFLKASPLTEASARPEYADLFRRALQELRTARSRGLLTGERLPARALASEVGAFARFSDPQAVIDEEWKLVEQTAGELKEYPRLCKILSARSKSGRSASILAMAVRYYFRREVETDQQLCNGLAIAKLDALQESQEKGFAALTDALTQQGRRLEGMLDDLLGKVEVIETTTADTNVRVRGLEEQFKTLLDQLQLQNREVRPSDSLSIRNDAERQLVKNLVLEYRALPEEQRRKEPTLLNSVGKLEVVVGEFEAAQRDFQAVAAMTPDPKVQAEAHFNAYQAALERQDWPEALVSLQQAVNLDAARFAPFPLERYDPQKILGAGGFGVAFFCRNTRSGGRVVIKTLRSDGLDRGMNQVFGEAQALEELEHPAIIRIRDCDFAGAGQTRPYLVMDYFDGVNLESYVAERGPLSPEDMLAVASQVAEALQVAHNSNILHRDIKPANVLVRRDGPAWRVKLIDFGLALRPESLGGHPSTSGPRAQTTIGKSIAGTLHYAAPEQMGQAPAVAVGRYSDVYGFGRTCYFALLQTPSPDREEEDELPPEWGSLLRQCTRRDASKRLQDFSTVLAGLAVIKGERQQMPGSWPKGPESEGSRLLFKFWEGLLSRPKVKTTRHADVAPHAYPWFHVLSGVRGTSFTYRIQQKQGRVEFFIDRGSGNAMENKQIFDHLHGQKYEIEKAFGGELSWERLDDKRASRIYHAITDGGYKTDESKWPEIQDAMIDAMIRLENALAPHVANLKLESPPHGEDHVPEPPEDLDPPGEPDGDASSGVIADVRKVLEEDGRWQIDARPNCIILLPKTWLDWLPKLGLRGDPQWWICVHIGARDGRLNFAVDAAPMVDLTKRAEIVTRLLDVCPGFGFRTPRSASKEVKNNYSRITATERILEWGEDSAPDPAEVRAAVKNTLDDLYPKLEKLAVALKPLCKLSATTT